MMLRAALVLWLTGCGAPNPARPVPAVGGDGEILERRPCPVPADRAAFDAELDGLRADIEKAGLAAELVARPLTTIFVPADHERLGAAARSGRCERVVYRSGALRVVGFVVTPPTAGPHPVVVWLRGGNRDFGRVQTLGLLWMLDLADAGFTVVATQYRGADGGEGHDEFGGADVADVQALVPLARRLPGADVDRLYLVGGSRGAMDGLVAVRRGLPVRAAAFRGGMYDAEAALAARPELGQGWAEMIPDFEDAYARQRALEERSAIRWVDELRVPILLGHGRQDWRVLVADAEAFAAALAAAGTAHQLVIYEREEHQLVFHRAAWTARIVDWFRQHGAFAR